jgi:aldehyde dehydrogenase (NAD+)
VANEPQFERILRCIGDARKEGAVLASGVWTTNLSHALRVSRAVHAGTVWVNTYRASSAMAPFGGFKDSRFGNERGVAALDEFLQTKNVMIDLQRRA